MTDCLINLNRSGKHSEEYFQRGLRSLTNGNKKLRLFNEISFSLNDNDRCVKQLSASLRQSSVNFFVTLTCNQKHHPWYATKKEEHDDARITSGTDGKNFRLRDVGIENKRLASV